MKYIIFLLSFICLISCENEVDLITTCPVVVYNDTSYNNSIQDPSTGVRKVWVENNCMYLTLSYIGGCDDHHIGLLAPSLKQDEWSQTDVNNIVLEISHINEDPCNNLVILDYGFDISKFSSFANNWHFSFANSEESILVNF